MFLSFVPDIYIKHSDVLFLEIADSLYRRHKHSTAVAHGAAELILSRMKVYRHKLQVTDRASVFVCVQPVYIAFKCQWLGLNLAAYHKNISDSRTCQEKVLHACERPGREFA